MARNDVYLNINSLSPADAVVTGQQDMTAATIPELVLGDTPTFNFYFTDNTNVWPSWAGNAAYTLTWALSDAVAGDFAPAATTGNATPITGGWSVVLPLNSYDLVGLLNTKRVGQPYPVQNLWQQLRVTDPSGNEITRAMVWTPVRYRAISDTQNTESASPTGGRFVTVNNVNELTTPTDAQFYAANPVPTSALGTASNGQLFIGNGTGFTKATLTAGTGVSITNGSGSITIDASGAQETLTATVKNAESVAITKGQVVYLYSATGGFASVKLAYNTSDATSAKTFGIVSDASIAANGTGTVTCVGVVDGLNLGAYNDGDTVYLGATPGSFTATKPYAPNHLVYVGIIERANSGNGELYVRVQNGYELDEIHDVQITTPPASGSLLIRDNTNSLWKAARLTAGTNIAVTNGDAAVTVGLTGTVSVANGGTGVTTSTGSGSVVLSTSPSLTTPSLGAASATSINGTSIPSSKTLVVTTDKLSALAATTSSELAGVISDETGTGSLVFANTPTLVTPNIGAATGTSFNLTGSGTLGTTLVVNSTTDSSSKDTGAIITEGGLGVEKSATIGGSLTVKGTTTTIGSGSYAILTTAAGAGSNLELHTVTAGTQIKIRPTAATVATFDGDTVATTLAGNLTVSGTGNSTFGGQLGLNVTPSAWSIVRALQIENAAFAADGTTAHTLGNAYYDGSNWKRIAATGAVWYQATASAGAHIWYNTTSSTAGSTITWTQAMTLNSSGNLLLGTTTDSANGKLQLASHTTSAGGIGFGTDASLYRASAGILAVNGSTDSGFLFYSNGSLIGRFYTPSGGNMVLDYPAGKSLLLRDSSGNTALTLDSSQNATFAGTVTVNGSNLNISATNATASIRRASSGNGAVLEFNTTTTNKWYMGLRGLSNDNFYLVNNVAAATALEFDTSSNATFAGRVDIKGGAAGIATSTFRLGFSSNESLLRSYGADASTQGSFVFTSLSSDASLNTNALRIEPTLTTFNGSIKTAAPAGGTAANWKLGTVATVSPTSPNRTIEVDIGGTIYYIHAKTTNN